MTEKKRSLSNTVYLSIIALLVFAAPLSHQVQSWAERYRHFVWRNLGRGNYVSFRRSRHADGSVGLYLITNEDIKLVVTVEDSDPPFISALIAYDNGLPFRSIFATWTSPFLPTQPSDTEILLRMKARSGEDPITVSTPKCMLARIWLNTIIERKRGILIIQEDNWQDPAPTIWHDFR